MPDLAPLISKAVQELLSSKHLYQGVTIDFSQTIDSYVENRGAEMDKLAGMTITRGELSGVSKTCDRRPEFAAAANAKVESDWLPNNPPGGPGTAPIESASGLRFELPTVRTVCSHCRYHGPFNPVEDSQFVLSTEDRTSKQRFLFTYQCQNCKGAEVRFLVRRNGTKLTLCGRDPIEEVVIPKVIPEKPYSKHFRNAIVAHQSGQTLAGVFLLRVFIEQYWLNIPDVANVKSKNGRATGDELGQAYKEKLEPTFKERFPNLLDCYSTLSQAMHEANEAPGPFEECASKIEKHFDALRLWEIKFV